MGEGAESRGRNPEHLPLNPAFRGTFSQEEEPSGSFLMNTEKLFPYSTIFVLLSVLLFGLIVFPALADAAEYEIATVSGRLIADAHESGEKIELRIEGPGKQLISYAYTDGTGGFVFREVPLDRGQIYFVVVDLRGFKQYREPLDEVSLSAYLTIFLEPLDTTTEMQGDGPYVVDLQQLEADIPKAAVEHYEKGLEESSNLQKVASGKPSNA